MLHEHLTLWSLNWLSLWLLLHLHLQLLLLQN